jgi:hypothetical protein
MNFKPDLIKEDTKFILHFLDQLFSKSQFPKLDWIHDSKYIQNNISKEYLEFINLNPKNYYKELFVFGTPTSWSNVYTNRYAIWKNPTFLVSKKDREWIDEIKLIDSVNIKDNPVKHIAFLEGTYKSKFLKFKTTKSKLNGIKGEGNCIQILRASIYLDLLDFNNIIKDNNEKKERYLVYFHAVVPPKYTRTKQNPFYDEQFNINIKRELIKYKLYGEIEDIKPYISTTSEKSEKNYNMVKDILKFKGTEEYKEKLKDLKRKLKSKNKIIDEELKDIELIPISKKENFSLEKLFLQSITYNKIKVLKYLLNKGINPSIENNLPLNLACECGNYEIVKLLLKKNVKDNENFAKNIALNQGYSNIVKLFK